MIHHNSNNNSKNNLLDRLRHFLPSQAPLKDFIHHNTLHAFQDKPFHQGLKEANEIFGYNTYLGLNKYRSLYLNGKISEESLRRSIQNKGLENQDIWIQKLTKENYNEAIECKIGKLRSNWKDVYHVNPSKTTNPILFRLIAGYLDQGIATSKFPISENGFFDSIIELEKNGFISLFNSARVKKLIKHDTKIEDLLHLLVNDESLYEHYLFDLLFKHQGWSGMINVLENSPETLLEKRKITLEDFIIVELLLEIDFLDTHIGDKWQPISKLIKQKPLNLFEPLPANELHTVLSIWQEAYEWTYFDKVLTGVKEYEKHIIKHEANSLFQSVFCIDDRECSIRRFIEAENNSIRTYSAAGFFNVEFYFQPDGGKFYTKLCPAPVTPKFLIKESNNKKETKDDFHFSKNTHNIFGGWISQALGFWSAVKLASNIVKPTISAATNYSFAHMGKNSTLSIEYKGESENGLQIGFTYNEMADRIEGLLKSIGLVKNFAPIVYIIGHGASSVNNTYYAGYDCGACSGRPGSVNARVAAFMANHFEVRKLLSERGILIPDTTQFIGGLQDTTRDEIDFYDTNNLNSINKELHEQNIKIFNKALDNNANERSRRFETLKNDGNIQHVHERVKLRSVSLFEPRPEYNHATNCLCIVGKRELTEHLFIDRRAFLNSYDFSIDPEGNYLQGILRAVAPVCGGINLEYYFSRVDNQKLGSGSKLPHNVVGLFAVANGADGDLRPGLPEQMIEIHDPLRLLVIVEHYPETVLKVLKNNPSTFEWFYNEWIHLIVIHPDTKQLFRLVKDQFEVYIPFTKQLNTIVNQKDIVRSSSENIDPIFIN